jgi:hypothetical protein
LTNKKTIEIKLWDRRRRNDRSPKKDEEQKKVLDLATNKTFTKMVSKDDLDRWRKRERKTCALFFLVTKRLSNKSEMPMIIRSITQSLPLLKLLFLFFSRHL